MTHLFDVGKQQTFTAIAAFDLDYTIVVPKSGKKFPLDKNDWKLLPGIKERICNLALDHQIVIISNQGSKHFNLEDFKYKLEQISLALDTGLRVIACTNDIDRKPGTGMWTLLQNNTNIQIDLTNSLYTGDAAGRPGDFSDSDLKFALNVGIPFYTEDGVKWTEVPTHPLTEYLTNSTSIDLRYNIKEMIILVGPPASGKSTYSLLLHSMGYTIICQDTLVTKAKVISAIKKALVSGESIVIDRKNEYKSDRKLFIDMAKEYNYTIKIVVLDTPRNVAEHLCMYRYLTTGKNVPSIVYNIYYSKNEMPTEDEGTIVHKPFILNSSINNELMFKYLV